jgi:hypothetical protein
LPTMSKLTPYMTISCMGNPWGEAPGSEG